MRVQSKSHEQKSKTIITGCGRSGTKFLSELLNYNNIECGHEDVFAISGFKGWGQFEVESSWCAAPYLKHPSYMNNVKRVIHVVRDPIKVVSSFYRLGVFSPFSYRNFLINSSLAYFKNQYLKKPKKIKQRQKHVTNLRARIKMGCTALNYSGEINRAFQYWNQWNKLIENACFNHNFAYYQLNIECIDEKLDELSSFLGFPTNLIKHKQVSNEKENYPARPLPYFDLPQETLDLAQHYGFEY